jgi:hypothetical protein
MVRNYREYVDSIRKENPGMQLSTEDCHESFLETFDSAICVFGGYERFSGVMPQCEYVPVFQAIFHRCLPMYGSYATIDGLSPWDELWPAEDRWPADKEEAWEKICPDQFAIEISRGVTWGMQPMIHNFKASVADNPRYARDYRFMLDTAKFYHANRKYLFDGEMLHPGTMECPSQSADFVMRKIFTKCGQHKIAREPSLKRVFHSVWRAPDGSVAAIMVNWSLHDVECSLNTSDISFSGRISARTWKCVVRKDVPAAGVKISESFGYDSEDSTRFLQAALDSGLPVIVVDAKEKPWYTLPLKGRSNQTIIFEDGAVICAKRGAFKSRFEKLISFDYCTNVVIKGKNPKACGFKMWRKDYNNKKRYKKAEWRHAISMMSCENILIDGIGICESGGDGVYIAPDNLNRISRNITIRNCVIDKNYRQGISVISVDGLLVEDTELTDTWGTAPAAGIDFEPNGELENIKNIVVRRCRISGNQGTGILIPMWYYSPKTAPVSMLFEDCVVDGNKHSFSYCIGERGMDEACDTGSVIVRNCRFVNSRENAVKVVHSTNRGGRLLFENVTVENCGLKNLLKPDFDIRIKTHTECDPFTYAFTNVTVRRSVQRPVLDWTDKEIIYKGHPSVVMGEISVETAGVSEIVRFDDKWRSENFKHVDTVRVKPLERVSAPLSEMRVVDPKLDEMLPLPPIFTRVKNASPYVFYVDRPKTVRLRMLQCILGKRNYDTARPMEIYEYGSKERLCRIPLPKGPKGGIVEFEAKKAGFYEIFMYTRGNGIAILASNVPVAMNATKGPVEFTNPGSADPGTRMYRNMNHKLYFAVCNEKRVECDLIAAEVESFGAEVFDTSGKSVWKSKSVNGIERCQADGAEGLWSIEVTAPEIGIYEDYSITFRGVPGWLFLARDRYWYRNPTMF